MSNRLFRAFVSYCSADRGFASSLQRRLETYRLPRRLADRVMPLPGQARGRIGPVFRDRADLSAAGDLSAAVREAIAASSALVVVASPDAVASTWVAREIVLFREMHPEGLILVAQARGAPGEATPPALLALGTEPLAADFRPEGDGRRLAFLKIVAGLAGLPLDALVQRDAQRQVRRVTAVTLAAAVLAVVMGGLLVVALQARAEAERRRAGAEGLVQFMLSGLRNQLEGVGSRAVMKAVNVQALDYFDRQGDPLHLSDPSLLLRVQVLLALGGDDADAGRLESARSRIEEAYRVSSSILARRPRDAEAIFTQAQSEYWMGLLAWRKGDRAATTRFWRGYAAQAGALGRAEPGSVRGLMEQGYAAGNLCDLNHRDAFDEPAAERACRASIGFMERARAVQAASVSRMAGNRAGEIDTLRQIEVKLANRFGWLARVELVAKGPAEAITWRDREAATLDRLLADDPGNVDYATRRTWPDVGKAAALIRLDRLAEAASILRASLARHEAVLTRSRGEEPIDFALMRVYFTLARTLELQGQDNARELARARQFQAMVSSAGKEQGRDAEAFRAGLWKLGRPKAPR